MKRALGILAGVLVSLLLAPSAAESATPCCAVTAIDPRTGVVAAQDKATKRRFEFKVDNAILLNRLRIGQAVDADFQSGKVSVEGIAGRYSILGAPVQAAPAAPAPPQVSLPQRLPAAPTIGSTPPALGAAPPARPAPAIGAAPPPSAPPAQRIGTAPRPAPTIGMAPPAPAIGAAPPARPDAGRPPPLSGSTPSPPPSPVSALTVAQPPRAVAFLINGYTGCCIAKRVRDFLQEQKGVQVYLGNWNDLERKRKPGGFNPREVNTSDEYFIRQMQEAIAKIPDPIPIVIIGHSFGGDAVMQVAKRVKPRRIAFLGILDPVGRGGLRENVTWPVPSNVDYFFNRWQQNPPFPADIVEGKEEMNVVPFDSLQSGNNKGQSGARESNEAKQNTEKNSKCETKYRDPLNIVPQLLSHSELPNDGCIQAKMLQILKAKVFP